MPPFTRRRLFPQASRAAQDPSLLPVLPLPQIVLEALAEHPREHPAPAITALLVLREVDLPSLSLGVRADDDRVDELIAQGLPEVCRRVLAATTDLARREAWTALAELWLQPAIAAAVHATEVGSVHVEVLNEEELTYGRSRRSPLLDLRYLSTRVV